MDWLDFSLRIGVAVVLGSAIGIERQWRQRLAGLRTNALVATGAAAFVTLSTLSTNDASTTRMAAQVVSGIGFLGGGVILREGVNIRGLNTAATLWCSAAVGTLAGAGFFPAAAITATVILGANVLLRPVAQRINRQPTGAVEVEVHYRIQVTCLETNEPHIRASLLQAVASEAVLLKALRSEDINGSPRVRVQAELVSAGRNDKIIEQVTNRLSIEPGISAISWEVLHEGSTDSEAPSMLIPGADT